MSFLAETAQLKATLRKGWAIRGIPDGEHVGDHMYGMGLICLLYPWKSEADRARSLEMALAHDMAEAITGDIVPSDNIDRDTKHTRESHAMEYLRCLLIEDGDIDSADRIKKAWDEYETGTSIVAQIVHQIDKYDALHQAYLYARRYPERDLTDFKSHRDSITDDWLLNRANGILHDWDVFEKRTNSSLTMVFVIGGPGVGKGTQCALAADSLNFAHISVGELLRLEEKNPASVFSTFIRNSFDTGQIVPATLSIRLLAKELRSAQEQGKVGVLIDGFPRSLEQLQAFQQMFNTNYATIVMDCPEEILRGRLMARAASSGRDDDQADVIARRVRGYHAAQEEVIKQLSINWLVKVESEGTVEEVRTMFARALRSILDRNR